jgi:hypothetical protein
MVMNIRRTAMIALSAALILSGGAAFAADILKPSTPSLTAPAATTPAPADTTAPATTVTPAATTDKTAQTPAAPLQPGDGLKLSNKPEGPAPIAPEKIPDVLMAEMKEVQSSCEKNYFYSSFHDCKCISVKFLDARLKSDPNTSKDRVFNSVAGQCVDEPAIAGYVYKSCGDYMQHVRKDYVDFCKCSANKVAETYAKAPVMSLRYIESLRRNAFIDCGIRDKVEKPEKTPKKFQ